MLKISLTPWYLRPLKTIPHASRRLTSFAVTFFANHGNNEHWTFIANALYKSWSRTHKQGGHTRLKVNFQYIPVHFRSLIEKAKCVSKGVRGIVHEILKLNLKLNLQLLLCSAELFTRLDSGLHRKWSIKFYLNLIILLAQTTNMAR